VKLCQLKIKMISNYAIRSRVKITLLSSLFNNFLLTEREVFTEKYRTEVFFVQTEPVNLVPRAFVWWTRGETRKPWSGPVNFAFWLAYTIFSKNSRTWQLTITIYVCCVRVYFAK
jgi:hypothetical protein